MGDKDIAALFHGFYSHFVLRDLLAKITPGAIVLVAISTIFIWQPENVANYLAGLTFWGWTILLAFSWITGIAIQSIGEWFEKKKEGLGIRYYPKIEFDDDDKKWFDFCVEFSGTATQDEKRDAERFVVIKEACGNGFIALFIVSILLAVKIIILLEPVPQLLFLIIFPLLFGFKTLFAHLFLAILIYWTFFKGLLISPVIQTHLGAISAELMEDSLVVGGYDKIGILLMGLIITIIFMLSLCRMHKEHVKRQYDYMLAVIDC